MKYFVLSGILLLMGIGVFYNIMNRENVSGPEDMTEDFIEKWLKNENGTIATYIQKNETEDEDLVQGREALAETVGLVMFYALEKDSQLLFNEYYDQLKDLFLEEDGFVHWKLNEDGVSEVSSNAFIDDLRIMDALVQANDKWQDEEYLKTAERIGKYLNTNNVNNGIFTDFYERNDQYASDDIKLSYIDIKAMDRLVENKLLDAIVVENTARVLGSVPLKNGFYPLSYNVVTEEYTFDEQVNIVDQAILAYHLVQIGGRSEEFLEFIKSEMKERELVHGMYSLETKEPVVDYESPAIYGYLISYALLLEEEELAEAIYSRLKEFQVSDWRSEYYGGYSITDGNTHIFDNIIPLLAELEILSQ